MTSQSRHIWDEKTIAFSTYRKSGEAVATPTWVVPLSEGRYGFWTSSASGKAKRLRRDPRVLAQPCNNRGKVTEGTEAEGGTATVIESGPDLDAVQRQVRAKYGAMVPITRLFNTIGHIGKGKFPYGDLVVIVTPTA